MRQEVENSHKVPRRNIKINWSFLIFGNCSFQIRGRGSRRITKSVAMVKIATARMVASSSMHLALMKGLNPALMGLHLKTTMRTLTMANAVTKAPTAQTIVWKARLGKILRYRSRIEILVNDSEVM